MLILLKHLKYLNHTRLISNQLRHYASGLNLWNEELTTEIKHKIEKHWSEQLPIQKFNENDHTGQKYYVLSMFPYPSGKLHMGHVRVYTISDSIARYQRMNGKNVIHPIGWDAFGLPAENAAIERNVEPDKWTNENIESMKAQLKQLGCSFDWEREIATCDERYYKWTQELFLKLYEHGLVYQKKALVNWDPVDKTVLADEQVDEEGCSWRSGAKVERKLLTQWFVKTTKFAKQLLDGLDDNILQDWRDIIKLQRHWIGDCDGISIDFNLSNDANVDSLTLWTDKPEYLNNIKFICLADNHLLAKDNGKQLDENTKLLDLQAINPFTNEPIPIYVTKEIDYPHLVSSHLGMPCVNEEDAVFAQKYGIKFDVHTLSENEASTKRLEFIEKAKELNIGGHYTSEKLRDWLISRQRYWGTPIPMVHCEKCGTCPVARKDLPVKLPKQPGSSKSLSNANEWMNTTCPKCNGPATRETDTMDTFVDSSWYFLRYLDRDYKEDMFNVKKAAFMSPVDLYIGGKEHAVLHLYYARFVGHFLHSIGLLPEREPFKRLLVQGMVMGRSYRLKKTGKYLAPSQVDVIDMKRNKAKCKETGEAVVMQWEKMSKSKHNGTDPTDMFEEYGIDTTRLLILADVAPTSHRNWNSNTFPGIISWQRRLWLTIQQFIKYRNEFKSIDINDDKFKEHDDYMFDSRNYYIKGTTFNYCGAQQISVAISKLQGLTNSLRKMPACVYTHSPQFERALACQIILLSPMAPHFTSELWSGFVSAPHKLNNSGEIDWDKDVLLQKWPLIDSNYNMDLIIQINRTDISTIKIPKKNLEVLTKEEAIDLALNDSKAEEQLRSKQIFNYKYTINEEYNNILNITAKDVKEERTAESV